MARLSQLTRRPRRSESAAPPPETTELGGEIIATELSAEPVRSPQADYPRVR
jgi:hypothetical protein